MKTIGTRVTLGSGRQILESPEGRELATLQMNGDSSELRRVAENSTLSPGGRILYPGEFQGHACWILTDMVGVGIETLYER